MKRRRQLQHVAQRGRPLPLGPTQRLRTRDTDATALRFQPLRPSPTSSGALESPPSDSYFLLSKLVRLIARGKSTGGKNVGSARYSRDEERAQRAGGGGEGTSVRYPSSC